MAGACINDARRLSDAPVANIKQNLGFAFFYNVSSAIRSNTFSRLMPS